MQYDYISDNQSVSSKRSDVTQSHFGYLPNHHHVVVNQHLAFTDPILQNNVNEKPFRPTLKQTNMYLQKSVVFDLNSQDRIKKEYQWKPTIQKSYLNIESSNTYDIYPGKPRQNHQQIKPHRNPILQGDEKSYYIKQQKVRKEFAPMNQINRLQ
ncbi:hypothetical protein ABPG72_014152 [Tetrahymena utriculariae]